MKTIEELITDEIVESPVLGTDNKIYIHADKAIQIANEYAQSLAKEVVEEIEKQIKLNPYTDESIPLSERQSALLGRVGALQLSSLLLKQKFNIK